LLRWDASYVTDVWWPSRDGEPGQWSPLPVNPITANVTQVTPERAKEIAGPDADLYAEAAPGPKRASTG